MFFGVATERELRPLVCHLSRLVCFRFPQCPGRTIEDDPGLRIADLCGRWQKAPRIAAAFWDDKACPGYHEVRIYDDGTVYYATHELQPQPGAMPLRQIAGDSYYTLNRQNLQQLEKLVATFSLEQLRLEEPKTPGRRDDSPFNTSN